MKTALLQTVTRPSGKVKGYRVHLSDQYLPHCCSSMDKVMRLAEGYEGIWYSAQDVVDHYIHAEAWTCYPKAVTGIRVRYQMADGSVGETGVSRVRG